MPEKKNKPEKATAHEVGFGALLGSRYKSIAHYLFKCPTFWRLRTSFTCPDCGRGYRCYWNGNDCACGKIGICTKCAANHVGHES